MPDNRKTSLFCLTGQLGNGGSEKQLYLLLKHLDRDKYDPTVVVSSSGEGIWNERIRRDIGCEIISLGDRPAPLTKLARFWRLMRKRRPDLVLCWNFYVNAYALAAGSTSFIGCLRGELAAARQFLNPIHFRLCYIPKNIIANSRLLKEEIIEYGYPPEKISLIFNMFEMNPDFAAPEKISARRAEIRKKLGVSEDEILVAGAGRNAPEKDFHFFVRSFAEASVSRPDLKALLVGKGGLGVKKEIEDLGISSRVIVAGEIPDAKDIFPCADIFFLSSKYEGMPNVMLEALDARCAILAMDVGGVRDILGEENPYIRETVVDSRDAAKAGRMLVNLAENRELRTKISQYNARMRLPCFAYEKIMPSYYRLFERALAR